MSDDFTESDPPRTPPKLPARTRRQKAAPPAAAGPAEPPPELNVRPPDGEELTRIIGAIVRGLPELELLQFIARDMPNLTPREALAAAMIKISENADADPTFVFAWSFEAARYLFRQLVAMGEYTEALKCLKFINDTAARMAAYKKETGDVPEPQA